MENIVGIRDKKPGNQPRFARLRCLRHLRTAVRAVHGTLRAIAFGDVTYRASRQQAIASPRTVSAAFTAISRPAPPGESTGGPSGRLHGSLACALWGEGTCCYPPTADFCRGNQSPHTHRLYSGGILDQCALSR